MTKLADFIKLSYSKPAVKVKSDLTKINIDLVTNDIPSRLMSKLKNTLKSNKKAHDLYYGIIEKPSGSEYDIALAYALKNEGYNYNEIGNILYHYEYGSISKKADGTEKWRQIERSYTRCDKHIPTAEGEFESLTQDQLDEISAQSNPILKELKNGKNLKQNLKNTTTGVFQYKHLPQMDWQHSAFPIYKDFLYEKAITVIYGQSNVGKSFVAADIAGHVALRHNWGELKYKPKEKIGVLYICAEAGPGFGKRGKALRTRLQLEKSSEQDFPFFTIDASPNFAKDKNDVERIVQTIKNIEQEHKITIELVVVDTLATTFEGGNENSSEDMGMYISNMKYIQRYADTGVLIVHHSGKDQAAGARGHSSLRAATDTEIEITAEKAGERYNRTIIVKKQREGENDIIIPFALNIINIGIDDDGDPITTCYVVLKCENDFDAIFAKPEDILTGRKKAALLTCLKFQQPDLMQWCKDKTTTEIRKLMIKNWFLTKHKPDKTLSIDELKNIDVTYNYSSESSNFSNDFNNIKGYLNNTKLKLDQWIRENLVKP